MRELIRLLSSRLPVGIISGIWGFILPLLYNSPSLSLCRSPALYFFHTRSRQNLSAIANQSLHSPGPVGAPSNTSPLFFLATLSALHSSSSPNPIPTPPPQHYTPLRLIRPPILRTSSPVIACHVSAEPRCLPPLKLPCDYLSLLIVRL